MRKGTAPPVGTFVELEGAPQSAARARCGRAATISRATSTSKASARSASRLARINVSEPPAAPGSRLRYATVISGLRDAIDARIRAVVPGDKGAIASALITGKRDAISAPVNDAMYVSSLAHVLSISGYHMALVAGVVFFVARALARARPGFAIRYPIKKWAALAALGAAAFYLCCRVRKWPRSAPSS